ncbi:hypothetical protein [Actinophytocola oryzae]|uniref:MYXO-CTERM domain-containing protein n=1 Tax=Actinophytocola oryzae TaxID=502181 RepID=A0A4R7VWR0_9PSEU|nr:hypothetical protein [Actinophytocola oryzae]TDV54085.1 hypothetical protein CLV71_104554 [Actinophytocola oryzae]
MRRRNWVLALAVPLLLAAPARASADVIFDPADADELAASLAEAYADQGVCYGWQVDVQDVSTSDTSIGSNFGANKPVTSGSCKARVEFTATITYTSESSESEDSASYDVSSNPAGVTRDDLDALGIDFDGLTGEDPDVAIGKAVTALPLLAADKGVGKPIAAAPETGAEPADAQLTDDPGSDWWRGQGGMLLWGLGILLAAGVFVWWVLKTNRPRKPSYVDDMPAMEMLPTPPPPAQEKPRQLPTPTTDPAKPTTDPAKPTTDSGATASPTGDSPSRAAFLMPPAGSQATEPPAATPARPSGVTKPTADDGGNESPAEPATSTTSSEPVTSGESIGTSPDSSVGPVSDSEPATGSRATKPPTEGAAGEKSDATKQPPSAKPPARPDTSTVDDTGSADEQTPSAPPDRKDKE